MHAELNAELIALGRGLDAHSFITIDARMSGVGESRTELLTWLNDLLKLNYTKIEQCGTGAAYCQIMDSIYGDVPMHRVKFNSTAEYEFMTNFKILQSCFTKHKVEKIIYVEKLVRCRFQDNLEFLQWLKRYWTQHKDESIYDPDSRRKFRPTANSAPTSGSTINVAKRRTSSGPRSSLTGATRSGSLPSRNQGALGTRRVTTEQLLSMQAELSQAQANIQSLQKELTQYKEAMPIMERERDFYFGKLRDIEILSQSTKDLCKEGVYENESEALVKFLNKVQQILYATEEGFEVIEEDSQPVPQSQDALGYEKLPTENLVDAKHQPPQNLITDEETF